MSAPLTDLSSSSISSSGHVDGLGRRALAFDRETGAMLERLYVRPELTVFEQLLKRRIEQLQALEDERIARPRGVERDPATGELVVVAEFIAGSRLSELLDVSADEAVVPGVDVALGYLVDGLEGLAALHNIGRVTHGLIDPSRTILSADGQVIFLDVAFGAAIERMNFSASRLWSDFDASGSAPSEPVRFDATRDVTQAALGALMLVLGRNLRKEEYPDALPSLLMEVIEVAQIRGSSGFATALQRFLQRSLPLPGRRPFGSADEALAELRQLVRKEIGLDVCRQAVIDFVAQMDAAFTNSERAREATGYNDHEQHEEHLDRFLGSFGTVDGGDTNEPRVEEHHVPAAADATADEDDSDELEISLEQDEAPAPAVREPQEEIYDLNALDDAALGDASTELASYRESEAEPPVDEVAEAPVVAAVDVIPAYEPEPEPEQDPQPEPEAAAAPAPGPEPEPEPVPEPVALAVAAEETVPEPQAAQTIEPGDAAADEEKETSSSRRRKRQQQKSARARKDKLRSTTDHKAPPPPPPAPPPPPKPASPSGWLVSPQRAAASEMLIPEPAPAPPPRPVPTVPSFSPTPVGFAQPTYANPAASTSPYGAPSVIKPAPPAPKPIAVQPPPAPTVKVKPEPTPIALRRPEPLVQPPVDRFSTLSLGGNAETAEQPRAFPWRLAVVAVFVAGVAIVLGRSYLPGRSAVPGEAGAQTEQSKTASSNAAAAGAAQAAANEATIPPGKSRIFIESEPTGTKVLLDRKPVGETPITVDTTPGRHVLTFITSGGEITHNVRTTAGKLTSIDMPVFSGWLSVVAPFTVDIAEGGQSQGTSEQSRIMMPPGRHKLTLSNKELGFSQTMDVDIEPGGVRTVSIDPKGIVHINAAPWAEVWLDGTKLGETPIADVKVPLGTREFVLKNPQYGEKRITATVRGNAPTSVSFDFTKQ